MCIIKSPVHNTDNHILSGKWLWQACTLMYLVCTDIDHGAIQFRFEFFSHLEIFDPGISKIFIEMRERDANAGHMANNCSYLKSISNSLRFPKGVIHLAQYSNVGLPLILINWVEVPYLFRGHSAIGMEILPDDLHGCFGLGRHECLRMDKGGEEDEYK